ncbi:MAG: alpha/beta hydrolase [Clostridia bacterium]|nr:alpha/beta hydrolase [Clostridia bacterium]
MSHSTAFTFPSVTGCTLDARLWLPQKPPAGIVQFVHGMAEHIDRYDDAAQALTEAGYIVTGHTHQGHGEKAEVQGHLESWQSMIDDVHALRMLIQKQYPELPYFLFGHSMGSFVLRCYLTEHSEGLAGAVISGTGYYPPVLVTAGLAAAGLVCLSGSTRKPSPLVDKLAFSANNNAFKPARTDFDWLSRDEKQVDKYIADPLCGFLFTGGGYRELFRGLKRLNDLQRLKDISPALPVLFLSGDSDPVGQMGKGVKTVAQQLRTAGIRDVTVRLYPGGRHEMLNEINRDEVKQDLIAWLDGHLPE